MHDPLGDATPRPVRRSIAPTYDSRETGPRYWVSTALDGRTIRFRQPVEDPFAGTTVTVGWPDLLRGLLRGRLKVTVTVGADERMIDDVLELDANTLVPNSTRQAEFRGEINAALGRMDLD